MSPVGLAHFIELVVLFIIGIQVFSFGLIAAFAAHGVCWAFMQMVFPDYTYWLIGA